MDKTDIIREMEGAVAARGCFIVDVTVSKDNDVELTIESEEGVVDLQDCESLSNAFQEIFDRDKEDYSLTVTSAGLDQPYKVLKQYLKAIGTQVDVLLKGGRKVTGTMTAADESGITVKYTAREAVEGKKKKVNVEHEDAFPFSEINSVLPYIVFD